MDDSFGATPAAFPAAADVFVNDDDDDNDGGGGCGGV